MNIYKKRHALLSLLYEKRKQVDLNQSEIVGVSFDHIKNSLKITDENLHKITAELINQNEIDHFSAHEINGLYCTKTGAASFSNQKYLKLNLKEIKSNIKDWVQITIPVIALIISILMALFTFNYQNRIKKIENKIELIQNK